MYAVYFTAVAVSPPPVSTISLYNTLLQRGPFFPLLPSYHIYSPSRPSPFTLLVWYPFWYSPRPSRLVHSNGVSKPYELLFLYKSSGTQSIDRKGPVATDKFCALFLFHCILYDTKLCHSTTQNVVVQSA